MPPYSVSKQDYLRKSHVGGHKLYAPSALFSHSNICPRGIKQEYIGKHVKKGIKQEYIYRKTDINMSLSNIDLFSISK